MGNFGDPQHAHRTSAIIVSDSAWNRSSGTGARVDAPKFALRRRDPADRRRHLVEITDEGLRAFDTAEKGIEGVEGDVLASLTSQERVELQALLAKALD